MPDRDIATSLRLLVLFGSRASRLGWLQLAVGFAGVLIYNVVQGVDTNFYRYWGTLEKAEATVIDSVETEYTYRPANRAEHTWENFDEVRFRFVTPDGAEHEGTSLTSKPPANGARVEVEYPRGSPALARIVGTSRDPTFGVAPIVNGIVVVVALNLQRSVARAGGPAQRPSARTAAHAGRRGPGADPGATRAGPETKGKRALRVDPAVPDARK